MRIQITERSLQELLEQGNHNGAAITANESLKGISASNTEIGHIIQQYQQFDYFSVALVRVSMKLEQELELITGNMPPSVSMNFMMKGSIHTQFEHLAEPIKLKSFTHNLLYNHNSSGYHVFPKTSQLDNIHVSLAPDYFKKLCSDNSKVTDKLKSHMEKGASILASQHNGKITHQMAQALQSIVTCPFKGPVQRLYLEGKVLELLALQLNQFEQVHYKQNTYLNSADIHLAEEVKEFLQGNYLQMLSLKELAKVFGTNEFRLKKVFRDRFGGGIFNYAQTLRLEHAKLILLEENKSITEVAETLGYNHTNHFSRAFRRHFGCSPSQLRK